MNFSNILRYSKPFEPVSRKEEISIFSICMIIIFTCWFVAGFGDKHLFPTIPQVMEGLSSLWSEGLITHIGASLLLCIGSILIASFVSMIIVYISPIPYYRPLAFMFSKLRFLPLTGLTFYLAVIVKSATKMQYSLLVIFMSSFLITTLLAMLRDIDQEEYDLAKSMKASRWETLWVVVVKGRMDYILDAVRQNLAIVWMMVVTVESILVANGGLGTLIKNSDKFANHGRVVAVQLVILTIGITFDFVLTFLRRRLFPYSVKSLNH